VPIQAGALGLRNKQRSVQELLEAIAAGDIADIRVVWRPRDSSSPITLQTVLADTKCRSQEDAIVNESTGFYEVSPDETVLFLSKTPQPNGKLSFYSHDTVLITDL